MSVQPTTINQVFGVLIATFPAKPTDKSVDSLQEELLQKVEYERPRGVIIDISRVTTMDSFFARVITETANMVSLMGSDVIVVGIQPSVAITAAELGYGFTDMETARNVDHALSMLGIESEEDANE